MDDATRKRIMAEQRSMEALLRQDTPTAAVPIPAAESDGWEWLASTDKLQREAFGKNWGAMSGSERANAFAINILAASDELHEALAETEWKPWSSKQGGFNREAFLGELVDAQHFIANLLLIGGYTENEFWDAYRAKQTRNRARQTRAGGYDAHKNRCPYCTRELDKPRAYEHLEQEYVQKPDGDVIAHTLQCNECRQSFTVTLPLGEELP